MRFQPKDITTTNETKFSFFREDSFCLVAIAVSDVAGATSTLTGSVGMDLIFAGGKSPYAFSPQGGEIRILVKADDNSIDPRDIYRIVRFSSHKKERRFQWLEFASSAFETPEAQRSGFVNFTGHKYGESSYILSIPTTALQSGEYGVLYMSSASVTAVPVGTFGIR